MSPGELARRIVGQLGDDIIDAYPRPASPPMFSNHFRAVILRTRYHPTVIVGICEAQILRFEVTPVQDLPKSSLLGNLEPPNIPKAVSGVSVDSIFATTNGYGSIRPNGVDGNERRAACFKLDKRTPSISAGTEDEVDDALRSLRALREMVRLEKPVPAFSCEKRGEMCGDRLAELRHVLSWPIDDVGTSTESERSILTVGGPVPHSDEFWALDIEDAGDAPKILRLRITVPPPV